MHIGQLKNAHKGETAWIVGRGPSLSALTKDDIGEGIVIAINKAIANVDALGLPNMVYSMYKDGCGYTQDKSAGHQCFDNCPKPLKAPIFTQNLKEDGENCFLDYTKRYLFTNESDLGLPHSFASTASSIMIAKYLGCTSIKMLCFDAYTDSDYRALDPDNTIQKTDTAYIGERAEIDMVLKKCGVPVEFVATKKIHGIENNDRGVVICIPMFDGKTFANCTVSLAMTCVCLAKLDIPFDIWPIVNSCYIHDARNRLFTSFLGSKYKKMFFIDSDIGWDVKDFFAVLECGKPISGAAYPMRNKWNEFVGTLEKDENGNHIEKDGLVKVRSIATGFMCIDKTAAKQVVRHYPAFYRLHGRSVYNVFGFIYQDGLQYMEDIAFCMRWVSTGGELWVVTDVTLSHEGSKQFIGNLGRTLSALNAVFDKHGSDKGNKGHQYGPFYEKLFERFRNVSIKMLEIGISCKGTDQAPSLTSWAEYFPFANIVGFDFRDFKALETDRIKIEQGDQGRGEDLAKVYKHGPFDIIIDDGSHIPQDQITTFLCLRDKIKPGGVYVVEDLIDERNAPFYKYVDMHRANFEAVEYTKSTSIPHSAVAITMKG